MRKPLSRFVVLALLSHTHARNASPRFAPHATHERARSWTTWLISSIESRNRAERTATGMYDEMDERFHQPQGSVLLVRGHVRQVARADNDSFGMGIPTYTAVIDYMVESEKSHETIQIRKQFETQHALEQGFSNVELLVLPDEPTHSILRDDFEQQVQQEKQVQQLEQEREKRKHISSFDSASVKDDGPLGEVLEGGYCDKKCKRMTVVFAATLVLASLAGTLQVVCLMDERERWKGWLSFWFGLAIITPIALLIHRCLKLAQRWNESSEKHGYIVQSTNGSEVTSPNQRSMKAGASMDMSISDACMPPSCGDLVDGLCDSNGKFSYAEAASYIVPETGGCYFVRYPNKSGSRRSGASSSEATPPKPQVPREHMAHRVPPPEQGGDDGLAKRNSSTSSVSSLSSQDHADSIAATWSDHNDST